MPSCPMSLPWRSRDLPILLPTTGMACSRRRSCTMQLLLRSTRPDCTRSSCSPAPFRRPRRAQNSAPCLPTSSHAGAAWCARRTSRRSESVRKRRQNACPAAGAFMERPQVVFFIRGVHAVIVERKADEDGVHPEHPLEVTDDWDGAALAYCHRLLPPLGGERLTGLGKRRIIERKLGRRRPGEGLELGLGVGREPIAHEGMKGGAHLLRVLAAHQAK